VVASRLIPAQELDQFYNLATIAAKTETHGLDQIRAAARVSPLCQFVESF